MRLTPFWRKKAGERGLPELQEREVLRPRFMHHNPVMPGVLEVITQGAYDFYAVAAATAVAAQILFTIPRGGQYTPTGGSAFTKQKYHTNLTQAGQLSAPSKLMVKGLSAYIRTDIAPGDLNLFTGNTLVTFQVDQKDYLNIVLAKLPAGGGTSGAVSVFQAAAANASYSSIGNGWPEAGAIYALEGDGVQIEQQQNFAVVIDPTQVQAGAFTTAAAASTTFGNGINMIFTLEGLLSRAVL